MTRRRKYEPIGDNVTIEVAFDASQANSFRTVMTLPDGSAWSGVVVCVGGSDCGTFIADERDGFIEAVERIGGNETAKARNSSEIEG